MKNVKMQLKNNTLKLYLKKKIARFAIGDDVSPCVISWNLFGQRSDRKPTGETYGRPRLRGATLEMQDPKEGTQRKEETQRKKNTHEGA